MMLGAERGSSPEQREMVGMLTSFCLMLGLAAGSNSGVFLSKLI